MNVLLIGDVVGRPGRDAVRSIVPELRESLRLDLVIANGENAAGGRGLTSTTAMELMQSGVDVITSGNHIWHQKELLPHLDSELPILRPLNYPPGAPGRGWLERKGLVIVNLIGRIFVGDFDCPFRAFDRLLEQSAVQGRMVLVDFHGEATSEKQSFAWYVNGRAAAVVGTHTHVPTSDARILPGGTAYVTDLGMTGPRDSVIGVDVKAAVRKFVTQIPAHLAVADGPSIFNAVLVELDEETGKARRIERVDREAVP